MQRFGCRHWPERVALLLPRRSKSAQGQESFPCPRRFLHHRPKATLLSRIARTALLLSWGNSVLPTLPELRVRLLIGADCPKTLTFWGLWISLVGPRATKMNRCLSNFVVATKHGRGFIWPSFCKPQNGSSLSPLGMPGANAGAFFSGSLPALSQI
jgi:hypothetical protein